MEFGLCPEKLKLQATSKNGSYSKLTDSTGKNYTASKLKKGTTYYYRVRGYAKDGKVMIYSNWSEKKNVKIKK